MPGKGRAAHGGGAAKWRHGWIPANAAAQAIVAARAARARPTEESSSPGRITPGHLHVEKRGRRWHVVDEAGHSQASFTNKADADTQAVLGIGLVNVRDVPDPQAVDEATQILLRSPDPESGTPSLFRGRRNIVTNAPPPFLGPMAHIEGPHTPEDDSVNSNPGYYTTKQGILGIEDKKTLRDHQVNCYNCVQAYELRRRGYAVQAAPAETNWYGGSGKSEEEIAAGWRTQDGMPAEFTNSLGSDGMMAMIAQWPPGSRGWVSNQWKHEVAGHVFVVEKDAQDKIHFYDPQPGGEVTDYLQKSEPQLGFMRTDNLVPTQEIAGRVESSSTISGTWRPSRKMMITPLTQIPGMKKWLDAQAKAEQVKLDKIPDTPNRAWDRQIIQARLQVYDAASKSTPAMVEDAIETLKGLEQERAGTEKGRLNTIQRKLSEEILRQAVPNATGILMSGVPVTPGQKAVKRWRQ